MSRRTSQVVGCQTSLASASAVLPCPVTDPVVTVGAIASGLISPSSLFQRLEEHFGPPSRDVSLLARFARRRTTATNPLHLSLSDLLLSQSHLYSFLAFLRAHDAVHTLQLLLTLGTVRGWAGPELTTPTQ